MSAVEGCRLVDAPPRVDRRGTFSKPYRRSEHSDLAWAEIFWSRSAVGVLRGMHLQLPPKAHDKLVWCVNGAALDVVVDLRADDFGAVASFELRPETGGAVFVPMGCAHGFLALEEDTVVVYAVTTEHVPELDAGVRWDSIGFSWPHSDPILSDRDGLLPRLEDFLPLSPSL